MNKNNSLLLKPVYPILIALAPVLSLFVVNSQDLYATDIVRPALSYVSIAVLALILSKMVARSYRGAAILACILVLSMITYGSAAKRAYISFGAEFFDSYFLITWVFLTFALYLVTSRYVRRTGSTFRNITIILNVFGLALIFLALLPLIFVQSDPEPSTTEVVSDQVLVAAVLEHEWISENFEFKKFEELPDFYFIVTDAYARGDVLKSRFDFDNSDFLDWLEKKGFFVANSSHSNYAYTHLSLSATLNGEYLQTLLPDELKTNAHEDFRSRFQLIKRVLWRDFIRNSKVHRLLTNLGYRIISSEEGYGGRHQYVVTRKRRTSLTDIFTGPMNQFEKALLSRTIAQPLIVSIRTARLIQKLRVIRYDEVTGMLNSIVSAAQESGPKFVFYHIVSPHEPFSFDSDGSAVSLHPVYDSSEWLSDKLKMPGYLDWVKENYPKNVEGLNHHLKLALQGILDASGGKAIIVLQADHGSALGWVPGSLDRTDIVERFGILNAIYLPADYSQYGLEHSMSSVNTFPVIFNNVFGLEIPTRDNLAFSSVGDLEFEDVTLRVREPSEHGSADPGFQAEE